MRARKRGKGGKHVAMERGLRPNGSGWPFRREMGELATLRVSMRQRKGPSDSPILKERQFAHTARLGGSTPGQVEGNDRKASGATRRDTGAASGQTLVPPWVLLALGGKVPN